ncbi:sensor histidine kinase [Streptomyces fulvoviolaceus]|uniref:sensor histidine kinase n=1 Tax=Streptomyces fulvoviolaceus TaxID=285535 RepID=UPI0030B81E91
MPPPRFGTLCVPCTPRQPHSRSPSRSMPTAPPSLTAPACPLNWSYSTMPHRPCRHPAQRYWSEQCGRPCSMRRMHARATAVVVTAGRRPGGGIVVAVTDDGVGLPPDHTRGVGLRTTADSVGRLGGTLRLTTDPQGGTTWRVELPC